MKKSIACIVYKNKKILIAHRNPVGQMGNRWEFPGGKVEDGESEEIAIKREMQEEFGVEAKPVSKITEGFFTHNGKENLLEVYLVQFAHDGIEKKYNLTEHSEYKWVSVNEIPKDNFVDSDLSVYPKVCEFINNLS